VTAARRAGALAWLRRDLRDFDNAALHHALALDPPLYVCFVFDRAILDALPTRADRRVDFIHRSVVELDAALRRRGGALIVEHADAREAIPRIARALGVAEVFAGRDYEPDAIARDDAVADSLAKQGIAFTSVKDHVVFERDDVVSQAGRPFSVFTPYRNAWLKRLQPADLESYDVERLASALRRPPPPFDRDVPSLRSIGFETTDLDAVGVVAGMRGGRARYDDFQRCIDAYARARDYPALDGSSQLSVHLRFGTVSVRELARFAHARSQEPGGEGAATWLSELVWRDFFSQILWRHPRVVSHAFRRPYDGLPFPDDPSHVAAWREARTGYPIVDAAMRQLHATGYMHNRLRMVAASFLVKHLLVDWRIGERHFADWLIDYDLASNNGNWQWAASTGCDAQPYFRIFNPVSQSQRFDADGAFIRRWVPELALLDADDIHAPWRVPQLVQQQRGVVIGRDYPAPIVDHAVAREHALAFFRSASDGAA
jgi:deoxyribodipyrimidine photo-lyase